MHSPWSVMFAKATKAPHSHRGSNHESIRASASPRNQGPLGLVPSPEGAKRTDGNDGITWDELYSNSKDEYLGRQRLQRWSSILRQRTW